MSFRETQEGLNFEANLDRRDALANSIAVQLERGDLTGVSVGFRATVDEWHRGDPPHRVVREAELFEISLTPFPAYKDTNVEAVRDAAMAELQAQEELEGAEEAEDEREGEEAEEEVEEGRPGGKDKDKDKDKKRGLHGGLQPIYLPHTII